MNTQTTTKPRPAWRRWAPLAGLIAIIALGYSLGWHRLISAEALTANYTALKDFVLAYGLLAALAAGLVYATATALSLPVGLIMTVSIGILFGWWQATIIVVISATLGASVLYWIARTSLRDFYQERAGAYLNKLAKGFARDAVSYMLFLRLVPAFPFVLVNFAPGILGVPFFTYFWTTLVGIAPGTAAYSFAGAGLASVMERQSEMYIQCTEAGGANCGFSLELSALITPELLIAFAALGLVALTPVVIRRFWPARVT
ncbi:MAG: TVP38/TMEM64 family protein [Alphaproteobacteria bacterium]|nr:TVP38/TMEM64 family protein [Alphaproteobacteria bacterium]